MTNTEFIERISEKTNMSKAVVDVFLEAVTETLRDALLAGGDILIPNLGTFTCVTENTEDIKDTDKTRQVDVEGQAQPTVSFAASTDLKAALNPSNDELLSLIENKGS